MKHSISYKMTSLILAVMLLSLVLAAVFSNVFLERYYTTKKQNIIKDIYEQTVSITKEDSDIEKSDNISKINSICEQAGATMILVGSSGEAVYEYGAGTMLADRWKDMIFGQDIGQKEKPETLEENDSYKIQSTVDKFSSMKYYELSGAMESGNYLIIRISVESIRESIGIANKFYLGVGIGLILIVSVMIILVMRRYTKPVLQLAEISSKMSMLDFEARYTGHRKDEIGVLGESINEMSTQLEKTISELKSANAQLHRDIERKDEIDEMRKEFIANVSHELKTPIALIQGYAEGLQEGIGENPEDTDYYCNVIIDEATKMNKMVKNLLNLTQLEFGDEQVQMERFDIVSVIGAIINSMQLQIAQEEIKIDFKEDKPIYVWADEFQIEEVITNYLSNALNHVDENKLIQVKITEKNGIVRVSVFNTGKQIPKDSLEEVWTKFYKVDKARTRAYGGNGIGLSIVKAIMDRHGKNCGVLNHENGVEFWFETDSAKK